MKTRKVKFIIEEVVSQEFEMDVPENAADEKIRQLISEGYANEDFVLEPGDLEKAQTIIMNKYGFYSGDWMEIA